MAGRINCICGAPLVEEVTDRGVYPMGGGPFIPFQRTTDYVMCDACLRTYDVRSLMARAETAETIESLEHLAETIEADEQE
ncbi:MAG TPA: hypothetical protein VKJ07_06570 [Mycobacteriales bacterium]|nr:hypothetical protein [Mycobacteriales bacterium]